MTLWFEGAARTQHSHSACVWQPARVRRAYPQRYDLVRNRSERVLGIAPESRATRKLARCFLAFTSPDNINPAT